MDIDKQWNEIMAKTTCADCKPMLNYKFRCLRCNISLMKLQRENPEQYKIYKLLINTKIQMYKYTISEYYTCECGRTVRDFHSSIYRHNHSKIHINYLNFLNQRNYI